MMRRIRLWLAFRMWWLSARFMDLGYLAAEGRTYRASLAADRGAPRSE